MTDADADQDDEDDEEKTFAPEWVADGPGFDPAETYAAHLHKDYWWLIQKHEDEYLAVVYDRDEGTTAHQAVVSKTTDGEWWESEQKIRSYKNTLCDADDVDIPESVLENELVAAHHDLQVETGNDVFGEDTPTGFGDKDLPDPIDVEELYERTAYVHRYRFGDSEEYRVFLEDDDGSVQKITLEGDAWEKEDGQSTKPPVANKASAVLDARVEVPWSDWVTLKVHWREDAETKHEEDETEWEYRADSVVTQLFMQARVVSDRAAVMNSSSEPVAWYDAEHAGAVTPADANRKPIDDDEPVVWVRMEDVAAACRDLGMDMSGAEKRSQMAKLSEAFRRKNLAVRGPWQTRVSGHNARLIPFKLSEIGVDEEDVVGGGEDDEEITPSGVPVGDDDDDSDDEDDGDADSGSSTDNDGGSGGEGGDDGEDKSSDDADDDADDGDSEDGEEDADTSDEAESEPSATESEDDADAVDGDSTDDTPETDSDDDDSNDEDDDVPTRSLPGSDNADPDDVDDDVLRTVAQVVEQEASGDGAVDVTTIQAACARQHSTNPADVTDAVDALEDAGVLESVSDDETAPGEESVESVINGGEQA